MIILHPSPNRRCKSLLRHIRSQAVFALALAGLTGAGNARGAWAFDALRQNIVQDTKDIAKAETGLRTGNFIFAPIPFSSDTIGNGLVLGAGYLFNLPGSKPSGVGLGYFETHTGSYAYGLGGSIVFDNDRWTVGAFVGRGELNYDLPITVNLDLPLAQSVEGVAIQVEYGFSQTLKAGVGLAYLDSNIAWNPSFSLPVFLRPDLEVELVRLSADIVRDTRNDTFYPTAGSFLSLKLGYGHIADSIFAGAITFDDRAYAKAVAKASTFQSVGAQGVLAFNTVLCSAGSAAPFFDSCGVGFVDGLRGFSALDALANTSVSAQVEYRGRLSPRFGYVAFAGAGAGGDDLGSLSIDQGGVAMGVGLRYRLSKKFGLDYAIDYARNDQGDDFIYLSLGQRF
ncbi:BamA/TamA family outer membrane protein [Ruegeria pomeroyi]|nr:BamA/TamA family outer membrane protein [Ruegeria pomeroyi]